MLSGDERAQDAVGHVADVRLARFAWKTGTSSGFRDAWTVAWNPEYVVAVWCGFKSGRRGSETLVGKKVAAPVAWEIIRHVYPAGDSPWYDCPAAVAGCEVCAVSGRVAGPLCRRRETDLALVQCSSCEICPVHVRDGKGSIQTRWPPEVAAFLQSQRPSVVDAPAGVGVMKIVSPAEGTVFRIAEGMASQQVVFKATGAAASEAVYWFRNDTLEGTTAGGQPFFWTPERGAQRVVCSVASGASDAVTIHIE